MVRVSPRVRSLRTGQTSAGTTAVLFDGALDFRSAKPSSKKGGKRKRKRVEVGWDSISWLHFAAQLFSLHRDRPSPLPPRRLPTPALRQPPPRHAHDARIIPHPPL